MQPSIDATGARGTTPTVMLVDDHPLWRETLRKVIERQGAGRVIAEASNGEAAVEAITEVGPDVVVMDVDLPGIDGVAATARIVADNPGVRVLFLSSFDDRTKVLGAVEAGASGYLPKTAGAPEIADAVGRVAAGELVFPPHLAEVLLAQIRGLSPQGSAATEPGTEANAPTSDTFKRSGEFWILQFQGHTSHVADLKGMADLHQLLASPGREILAVELVAVRAGLGDVARAGVARPDDLHVRVGSGAGPALDSQAKRAYQERMRSLQDEIDEAEDFADTERATQARLELQLLTEQLAGAVGLGGRDRPVASDVERARISVTRGIRRAIRRIEEAHPALGRHLDRSVRTGTFCCYEPEGPVDWALS